MHGQRQCLLFLTPCCNWFDIEHKVKCFCNYIDIRNTIMQARLQDLSEANEDMFVARCPFYVTSSALAKVARALGFTCNCRRGTEIEWQSHSSLQACWLRYGKKIGHQPSGSLMRMFYLHKAWCSQTKTTLSWTLSFEHWRLPLGMVLPSHPVNYIWICASAKTLRRSKLSLSIWNLMSSAKTWSQKDSSNT